MPTREKFNILSLLQKRERSGRFDLPDKLVLERARTLCDDIEAGKNPFCGDIEKALHHAAYARKEDIDIVIEMLEANPSLLLDAGNVITPGGLFVKGVTLYEFFLGAGDPEAAKLIVECFDLIQNDDDLAIGERERERQYERYRPYIEAMLTQESYYLKPLIAIIKQASSEDVRALLNNDMAHASALGDAIMEFRKVFAPNVLTTPGMHYNYQNLLHAFEIYEQEWNNLYEADGEDFNKLRLVWRQLIGFEMRRLPGIDRCALAQGLYYIIDKNKPCARSYKFKHSDGEFPVSVSDDSLAGLGLDFAVDIFGADGAAPTPGRRRARRARARGACGSRWENLCQTKTANLQNLLGHDAGIKRPAM